MIAPNMDQLYLSHVKIIPVPAPNEGCRVPFITRRLDGSQHYVGFATNRPKSAKEIGKIVKDLDYLAVKGVYEIHQSQCVWANRSGRVFIVEQDGNQSDGTLVDLAN
jgi:hypothetical protein